MISERWSTEKEIKRNVKKVNEGGAGPIVLNKAGANYAFAGEGNTQYLGLTGTGKTWYGTIPLTRSCIDKGESFLVLDSKAGEGGICYHTLCYAQKKGYKIILLNFRDILASDCYNPLSAIKELFDSKEPAKEQIAMEMLDELAYCLYPSNEQGDPFWIDSARSLFVGVCYGLMQCGTKEQATLESVYQFVAKGNERFGGPNNNFIKEFVNLLPDDSVAAMMLKSYTTTAEETAGGIRSTMLEGINCFGRSKALITMLGNDDVHLNELDGETPTAIYILLPDERQIFDKVAGAAVSQIVSHFIRIAHEKYKGKLPNRLHVILEELGNVGQAIPNLYRWMTMARSRNIRVHIVLQDLKQLDTIYGISKAKTITSNADVTIAYRMNNWQSLEELSKKCGEREVECNGYKSREPLITPSQLGAMQTGQALVLISGRIKFITWLPGYNKMFDCSEWKEPEKRNYTFRIKPDVFKIDMYVKEEKRKKMEEMMNSRSMDSEFPDMPSPFGGSLHPVEVQENKSDSRFDVDELVKKIDAKIAELEAQEEAEKRETTNKSEQKKKHKVILEDIGKEKAEIIKVVREITETDFKTVMENVKKLPYTIEFSSKYKAKCAKKKLEELGAKVQIE